MEKTFEHSNKHMTQILYNFAVQLSSAIKSNQLTNNKFNKIV